MLRFTVMRGSFLFMIFACVASASAQEGGLPKCCAPRCCQVQAPDGEIKVKSEAPPYQVGIAFEMLRINGVTELTVASVEPGGAAARGGLKEGDEIIAVNGNPVRDMRQGGLSSAFNSPRPVKLTVKRGDVTLDVEVTPEPNRDGKITQPTREIVTLDATASLAGGPVVGEVAPEIVGEDTDGIPFKLSDYRGKVVVLDFWGFW